MAPGMPVRHPSQVSGVHYPQPMMGRQALEGEEELEAIANQVAGEKEDRGSPKALLGVIVLGLIVVVGITTFKFASKRTKEAIAQLSAGARAQFDLDTYRGYLRAADDYTRILEQHDGDHPLTTARLAHTYAILRGEHGETGLQAKLDEIIARAIKNAPDNSDTIAARTLSALYSGTDRQKSASEAYKIVSPYVADIRERGGGMSVADLTLGLIFMEQGSYADAFKTLSQASRVMPRSVRAKVLQARAAFRLGRLGKAASVYGEVLRSNADHPGARAERALVRLQQGRRDDANADLGRFDEFMRKHPKDVSEQERALFEYAASELARNIGDEGKASYLYKEAVRRDPTNADFPYGLGRWLLDYGRARKALVPLAQAAKMEPNRKSFQLGLAEAEIETGKFASAQKRIEFWLSRSSCDWPAMLAKSKLLQKQGSADSEAFHNTFVKCATSGAGKTRAFLQQALHYRTTNRRGAALKVLESAIKEMGSLPKTTQGEVLRWFGLLSEEDGKTGTAETSYRQAVSNGDIEAVYRLVKLLAPYKRESKVRKELKKLCAQYLANKALPKYSETRGYCL